MDNDHGPMTVAFLFYFDVSYAGFLLLYLVNLQCSSHFIHRWADVLCPSSTSGTYKGCTLFYSSSTSWCFNAWSWTFAFACQVIKQIKYYFRCVLLKVAIWPFSRVFQYFVLKFTDLSGVFFSAALVFILFDAVLRMVFAGYEQKPYPC